MKRFTKVLGTIILSITTMTMVACGGKSEKEADENNIKDERAKITGNVVYFSPENQIETTTKIFKKFNEEYPNIKVEIQGYTGDVNNALTALAATGDLPDVVEGTHPIVYPLSQGWVLPITEFLEKDKEFEYVSEELYKDFYINKDIYAVPYKLNFSGVIVNLDLLEQLNLDNPEYDWTTDEFLEYAKKATNATYSGINSFDEFHREMFGIFSKTGAEWGYDTTDNQFNFTNGGFEKAFVFKEKMLSVPGLVASNMKNKKLRDEGKEDDYQKKFGKDVNAFEDGKILFNPTGLWNLDNYKLPFNYDYYPLPIDKEVGYKEAVHVSCMYMTTAVEEENKRAAFEVMKWFSYSVDGNKARYEIRKSMEEPMPKVFIPPTTHPEVVKLVKELDLSDGVKYMYENTDKSYRADLNKSIPGMIQIINEILSPQVRAITNGEVSAATVSAEMEKKANDMLEESRENLKSDMEANKQ